MNIELQTTSLEYSKRLKEFKLEQRSLFYWIKPKNINGYGLTFISNMFIQERNHYDELYSSFTASELMQLLPHRVTTFDPEPFNSFKLNVMKSFYCPDPHNLEDKHDLYIVNYECDSTECVGEDAWLRRVITKNIADKQFTDALAKMLIFILENKLI